MYGKEQTMTHIIIRNISGELLNQINGFIDRKDKEFTDAIEREIIQEMFDEDDLTDSSL